MFACLGRKLIFYFSFCTFYGCIINIVMSNAGWRPNYFCILLFFFNPFGDLLAHYLIFLQDTSFFLSYCLVLGGIPTAIAVSADLNRAAARQTQLWTASSLARYVSPRFAVQAMPCVWGWHECQAHGCKWELLFSAGSMWNCKVNEIWCSTLLAVHGTLSVYVEIWLCVFKLYH